MSAVAPAEPSAEPPVESSGAARDTVGAYARRWWVDVKAGELGSLPIIVGLIVIAIVFQTQNDRFLTAGNFVNLIVQTAPYAVIAMGVTFALLLGEIDLSIGFVSGVGGVLVALLLAPDGNEVPTVVAFILALGAGLGIGLLHGLIITKVGVPSFVVTLAGLLAWNGVVLLLIGSRGTVILQNDFVIGLANDFMSAGLSWILWAACVALYGGVHLIRYRNRAKAGLPNDPMVIVALRIGGLALALAAVVLICNEDRGVPYVGLVVGGLLVVWTYVLNRTRFGRHIYAVGGNAEAARRAGINVDRVKIACFMFCSFMAVLGGIILASRLRSVDTNTGGGQALLYPIAAAVIGGTSLFGGRGTMKAALLGALVMIGIDNGLGLLGLSSGTKFVVTGGVLLLAVTVDSISRRGREQSGRA
jgi:D-xylose transport system permease protein